MFRKISFLIAILLFLSLFLVSCDKKTTQSTDQCATPLLSPVEGSYTNSITVSMTCATSEAYMHYTINGDDPTSLSPVYSSPLTITSTTTIKAKAYKSGWTASGTASATYTIDSTPVVSTPSFSLPDGVYYTPQTVTILCATSGASIFYSTDGSAPSIPYTSPINITVNTTLQAKAAKSGYDDSPVASTIYTIGQFINVPAGTFTMGNTLVNTRLDELPTHPVTLSSFYISKYEVTQGEWQDVMDSNPAGGFGVGNNYPVYNVNWYTILIYCNKRSIAEGLTPVYTISSSTNPSSWGATPTTSNPTWNAVICNWTANGYRLPTEAEWEYAARGATNTPDYLYAGSNDINAVAWYDVNSSSNHLIGQKQANGLNTFDMSGNVTEWCWDLFSSNYYDSSPTNNPTGPTTGIIRVQRGGSWGNTDYGCRVSDRYAGSPEGSSGGCGLRLVRSSL